MYQTVITGSGSYIPSIIHTNGDFINRSFFLENKMAFTAEAKTIIEKFESITGIGERRYASGDIMASDMAFFASLAAINDSGINPETIDHIIVAHNFGDVSENGSQSVAVPSLANRVKHDLQIRNNECTAYDILFGCPGWVQAMIQADAFFKAGLGKSALVIGTETLSRVLDTSDRDSMIFSDGAGAIVLEYKPAPAATQGMLASCAMSCSLDEVDFINMGPSYHPERNQSVQYIKMKGRKVYEFAIKTVPQAMKQCLEKSGVSIDQLKKIFIHQANEKMDEAIIRKLYELYGISDPPAGIMPMCIQWLGNSSVATIPTLFDLVRKGELDGHHLEEGDVILFASVGAGMNINAVCYRY